VELMLLAVRDCPGAAALEELLAAALADHPGVIVHRREIGDERTAAETGMCGSPTLLINGRDPFAMPGQAPSLSCRLYRDAAGRPAPAPSAEALRRALAAAAHEAEAAPGQDRVPLPPRR
jgi:hypothetical protein